MVKEFLCRQQALSTLSIEIYPNWHGAGTDTKTPQMPTRFPFDAADEVATENLGCALAEILPRGAVVALCGALGTGKTRLVQAIAAAAGVDRRAVLSPTFVLIHEYRGRVPIFHFDAYRLSGDEEFQRLGPDEYFDVGGWTFIEWADRVWPALPADYLAIRIEPTGETSRQFEFEAVGRRYEPVVAAIIARLAVRK
jgi:tRNA threonylcarbamoyladenosine biosynthesis protein TsaE